MSYANIAIALVGMAAGAVQSRKARKDAEKGRKRDQTLIDSQMARQEELDKLGQPFLQNGQQNMDMVQQYLRRLGSGDRSLTMQTLAPEINAMTEQSRGGVAAARGMFPRGGQTAAQAGALPQQLQGGINNLMFSARPQAMQQLAQLGGNQASLGLGAMGQGAGLTNNMLQYGLDARRLSMEQGMAMGQGIGGYLQLLQAFANRPSTNTAAPYTLPSQTRANLSGNPNWTDASSYGFNPSAANQNYNIYSSPGNTQTQSGYNPPYGPGPWNTKP